MATCEKLSRHLLHDVPIEDCWGGIDTQGSLAQLSVLPPYLTLYLIFPLHLSLSICVLCSAAPVAIKRKAGPCIRLIRCG